MDRLACGRLRDRQSEQCVRCALRLDTRGAHALRRRRRGRADVVAIQEDGHVVAARDRVVHLHLAV